jgi:hypothetical protein
MTMSVIAPLNMQQSRLKSGGETITRLLEDLSRPGALERVREGERHLKDYVDAESRDLPPEMFSKLMADLHHRVQYMIKRCAAAAAASAALSQHWSSPILGQPMQKVIVKMEMLF